jgi:Na+-transporting NADH:ubiquinone oxidoreductase subunit NqrD
MFLLNGFKQRMAMPLRPFLLTLAVLGISAFIALYGLGTMLELEAYPSLQFEGYSIFDGNQFLQGASFFAIGLIAYFSWLEIGLDYVLKKLK